jgi:hypothetical protein
MRPDGRQNDGISLHFRGVALVSLVTLVALVARIPAPVFGLQFLGRCPRLVWCRAVGAESIRISFLCACVSVFPAAGHTVTQSQGHTVMSPWRVVRGPWRWQSVQKGPKGRQGHKGRRRQREHDGVTWSGVRVGPCLSVSVCVGPCVRVNLPPPPGNANLRIGPSCKTRPEISLNIRIPGRHRQMPAGRRDRRQRNDPTGR